MLYALIFHHHHHLHLRFFIIISNIILLMLMFCFFLKLKTKLFPFFLLIIRFVFWGRWWMVTIFYYNFISHFPILLWPFFSISNWWFFSFFEILIFFDQMVFSAHWSRPLVCVYVRMFLWPMANELLETKLETIVDISLSPQKTVSQTKMIKNTKARHYF